MKQWLGMAAALLLAGCVGVSPEAQRDCEVFDAVARELEPGGSHYQIIGTGYVYEDLARLPDRFGARLLRRELTPEQRELVLRVVRGVGELVTLSGIGNGVGYGSSSVQVEPAAPGLRPLFRNRSFLLNGKPEESGFFWELWRSENRPLAPELDELPANTLLACTIRLKLGTMLTELTRHSELAPLPAKLKPELQQALPEALRGLDGDYIFLLTELASGEGPVPGLLLVVPDPQGRLAGALAQLAGSQKQWLRAEDGGVYRVTPQAQLPAWIEPLILTGDGQLAIYSSPAALNNFAAPDRQLVERPGFSRLSSQLELEGIGFSYVAPDYQERVQRMLTALLGPEAEVGGGLFELPETLTVIRSRPNGLLMEGVGNWDFNQQLLLPLAQIPCLLVDTLLPRVLAQAEQRRATTAAVAACNQHLRKIGEACRTYAQQHDGVFPPDDGVEGFRALLRAGLVTPEELLCPLVEEEGPAESADLLDYDNVGYIYLGGQTLKSPPQLPLAIEWPFNHDDGTVNVLFVDGRVEALPVPNANSCKRVIATLQARFRYPEADFRRLFQAADRIDKMFLDE